MNRILDIRTLQETENELRERKKIDFCKFDSLDWLTDQRSARKSPFCYTLCLHYNIQKNLERVR